MQNIVLYFPVDLNVAVQSAHYSDNSCLVIESRVLFYLSFMV